MRLAVIDVDVSDGVLLKAGVDVSDSVVLKAGAIVSVAELKEVVVGSDEESMVNAVLFSGQ